MIGKAIRRYMLGEHHPHDINFVKKPIEKDCLTQIIPAIVILVRKINTTNPTLNLRKVVDPNSHGTR